MSLNQTTDEIQVADYLRVIKKRKFTLINCVVILVIAATIYSFKMTPVYQAKVRVLIERNMPKVASLQETMALDTGDLQYYKTQYELLKSRDLAKSVIQRLHLENSEEFEGKEPFIDFSGVKKWVESLLVQVGILEKKEPLEIHRDPYSGLVDAFLKKLRISPIRNSRLVDVGFQGYSPPLITEIANTTAEMYILKNIELRSSVEEGAGDWLRARIAEVQKKVEKSESALSKFLERKNIVGFDRGKQDIVSQKLSEINKEVVKAEAERVRLETLRDQLGSLKNDPEMLQSIPDYVKSEAILQLNKDYLALRREYAEKSKKFRSRHPIMLSVARRIKAIEDEIPKEVNRLLKSVEIDYQAALARESSMKSALARQKRATIKSNRDLIKYNALKREAESNKRVYDVLLKRLKETGVYAKSNESNIRIVDPAEVPVKPVKPRLKLNIALAGALGLFGGVFLVFFMESLDKTVRTQEDVESKIQIPFLGAVGLFDGKDEASVASNDVNAKRSEDFRILRTNILHAAPDNPKKVLMVSSSVPGEGKTTTVSKLGVTFAQLEKKVLMIDADLRKSRLHKIFGANPQPGLSEYLADENDLKSVVHQTRVKGLSIIPRGVFTPYSAEILSSKKFKNLLVTASAYFDIVLLDTPPVLQISDASIVAKYCDGIVFVVKSGGTDIGLVQRALHQLATPTTEMIARGNEDDEKDLRVVSSATSKVLGVVLNMVDYKKDGYYYSYYGKQYKGYYGQKAPDGKKKSAFA
ncbi:MAG: GumC family protein [Nitrospinales bacterium]